MIVPWLLLENVRLLFVKETKTHVRTILYIFEYIFNLYEYMGYDIVAFKHINLSNSIAYVCSSFLIMILLINIYLIYRYKFLRIIWEFGNDINPHIYYFNFNKAIQNNTVG